MAENKTVVVKKAEPKTEEVKPVEIKEEVKPVETKEVKTKGKFDEKQANAAAAMALKNAIDANSELAIRDAERTYAIEKQQYMLKKCKEDKVVTRTVSKLYAPFLGKVYTFAYNGIPVTIYCDGKPHEYPEFVANRIDKKLQKVSESNTYKEIIEERLS